MSPGGKGQDMQISETADFEARLVRTGVMPWNSSAAALGSKRAISGREKLGASGLGLLLSAVTRKWFKADMQMPTQPYTHIYS